MEKRTILALALCFLVLVSYQKIVTKMYPPVDKEVSEILPAETTSGAQLAPVSAATSSPVYQDSEILSDELYEMDTPELKLVFSKLGGSLKEVRIKKYDSLLLQKNIFGLEGFESTPFVFVQSDNKAELTYVDDKVDITKTFSVNKSNNSIELGLKIKNLSSEKNILIPPVLCHSVDMNSESPKLSGREKNFIELSISLPDKMLRKNYTRISKKSGLEITSSLQWVGSRGKYFCVIFKPLFTVSGFSAEVNDSGQYISSIRPTVMEIAPQSWANLQAVLYAGPQDVELLSSADQSFAEIVYFGKLDAIVTSLMSILRWIHKIVPNWGVCIILLSVLIFSCLYPFTSKSLNSMKRLQALQPEMEQIRSQHKDNPQKMNKEVMELYRKNKVNPFGGCLPLVFQMPVFFSLYQTLMRSIQLKGANFLWIKDLSEPDRLFVLSGEFPVIGSEINLLPLLMAVAMAVQQKMSMKNNVATGQAAEQQRIMAVVFPILFAFIFYHFPSGLALYWFCYTILTTVAQLKMSAAKVVVNG